MTEKIISGVFILITYKNKKHHEDFYPCGFRSENRFASTCRKQFQCLDAHYGVTF